MPQDGADIQETTDRVASRDGTTIGFRTLGSGPGLVLLHGAMMSSANMLGLARGLADGFTVHVPDRRGRGMSGGGPDWGLDDEVDDLEAVLTHTGAHLAFGLSSGAVIVLTTALDRGALDAVALYEPPLGFDVPWAEDYERALAGGRLGSAFAATIKGTGDPGLMTRLPRPVLGLLMGAALRAGLRPDPQGVPLRELVPTVRNDLALVDEAAEVPARLDRLRCRVLLMGGSRSVGYLTTALDGLGQQLPGACRVVLDGVGHIAADTQEHPELVAPPLREFFAVGKDDLHELDHRDDR